MSEHDERGRANAIASLREKMYALSRVRTCDKKQLAERQYELGLVLMAAGTNAMDELVEGFELIRSAHENGNEQAVAHLRYLAVTNPGVFDDVVSQIDGERRQLLDSLAPFPHQILATSAVSVSGQ
jgi:hypothetical protein